MKAQRLEDLQLWTKARAFCRSIDEILDREALVEDRPLRNQLSAAATSILSNIAEGFAQPTDRAFANYLYNSRASTAEARAQLRVAMERNYLTGDEFAQRNEMGDEVARITVGLIKYLRRSNRRNRGLGLSVHSS